jgi:histidine triad (HIT) family protein
MEDSVFTRIIKGNLPSHKIYEDDMTLAFLDIHPVQPGMTVVVPKTQVDNFEDLPVEYYQALWLAVQKVARRMREVFPDKKKIAVQVEGLDVPHAHVKLFPVDSGADFHARADMSKEPDHDALAALAGKMRIS